MAYVIGLEGLYWKDYGTSGGSWTRDLGEAVRWEDRANCDAIVHYWTMVEQRDAKGKIIRGADGQPIWIERRAKRWDPEINDKRGGWIEVDGASMLGGYLTRQAQVVEV